MDLDLTGKRAIVTGGSRGIGYAIAAGLAAEGAAVAVVARSQSPLDVAAETLRGRGSTALAVAADTSDDDAVRAMVTRVVAEFSGVDILDRARGDGSVPSCAPWASRRGNVRMHVCSARLWLRNSPATGPQRPRLDMNALPPSGSECRRPGRRHTILLRSR